MGYTISDELPRVLKQVVFRVMQTDSASIFRMNIKSLQSNEMDLIIYIAAVREAYDKLEMNDSKWIGTTASIAGGPTELEWNAHLESLLDNGVFHQNILQWVFQTK